MSIVDQEGRLFGGVNLFDAVAGVVVLAMLALGVVGYRLLRVPVAPRVITVVPSTLVAGPNLRVAIQGDNFMPFMRAFLQRTAKPVAVMHDLNPSTSFDGYTLVNGTQVALLVESPELAEVRLPDALLPGSYDLVLYNEAKIVAVREGAVTVTPAPPKPTADPGPEAIVRVRGRFSGLTKEAAGLLKAGARLPHGSSEPWGEILSVAPPIPDEVRLDVGEERIVATMANRWQVRAELRARCTVALFKCFLPGGGLLAPGGNVPIDAVGTPMNFVVGDLLPDVQERVWTATATVRLLGRPDLLALVRLGDADVSPGRESEGHATILSIERRGEISTELNESLTDSSVRTTEKIAFLECTVRFPVTKLPTGWWYRSQAIKAGAPITFQTDAYMARGTIAGVTNPR